MLRSRGSSGTTFARIVPMSEFSGFLLRTAAEDSATSRMRSTNQSLSRLIPFYLIGNVVKSLDVALIVAASALTGLAYHLVCWGTYGPVEIFLGIGALIAVNCSAMLSASGTYRPHHLADIRLQMRDVSAVWVFAFFLLSLLAFSLKISETYSRGATLSFFIFGWLAMLTWRLIASQFIATAIAEGGFAEQKIILLAEEGQLIESSILDELKRYGYKPTRTYQFSRDLLFSTASNAQFSNLVDDILNSSRKETIEGVFLMVPWSDRGTVERLMDLLSVLTVPVHLLPDRNVAHFLGNRLVNIGNAWIPELKRAPLTEAERIFKRLCDVAVATFVLTMLMPMMALVALLIKLESHGPILFMQTRNGFNGRPFRICKFRTMSVIEDGPVIRQATRNDPRVTRLGRLLRRTNIDELPQLLNVIFGDMSLVGPRPHAAAHNLEYEKVVAKYAYRYHVKPGLTGWAQINGFRGETRTLDLMEKRVEFDLWYINNWSHWLDLKILVRTLFIGLQVGAY
jgi:Undecaprenyl-phosphate glucose phosphotransferase